MKNLQKRGKITAEVKKKLVELIAQTGNMKASAAECGITPRAVYYAVEKDPEFKNEIDNARQRACLAIEREIRRRGLEGIEKDVWFGGTKVGTERQYSDKLLLAMAKANDPDRWSERHQHQIEQHVTVYSHAKQRLADILNISIEDEEDIVPILPKPDEA